MATFKLDLNMFIRLITENKKYAIQKAAVKYWYEDNAKKLLNMLIAMGI